MQKTVEIHTNPNAIQSGFQEIIPLWLKLALWINLFYSQFLFRTPFDIYPGYFVVFALLPVYFFQFGIPKTVFQIFGILLLSGLFHVALGNNTLWTFFKVFIGAFANFYFFFVVVTKLNYPIHSLFRVYLKGALVIAIISVVQFLVYVTGIDTGKGPFFLFGKFAPYVGESVFGVRINTFFGEPTYMAMFLSGAVFVAIHDLLFFRNKYFFNPIQCIIILSGVYFTFSGTLIGTIGIAFVLLGLNYGVYRYFLILIPVAYFVITQVMTSSSEFSRRYEGTVSIFLDDPEEKLNVFDYHGSSVILYNNFHIALENFKRNPLFGTGIGSHPIAFDKYSLTKNVTTFGFALNKQDANSMFNRLMSETGLFGLLLFAGLIVFRFTKKSRNNPDTLWLISSACLTVILINLARQGNYFLAGFPFYVWMYYAAWKENQKTKEEQVLAGE